MPLSMENICAHWVHTSKKVRPTLEMRATCRKYPLFLTLANVRQAHRNIGRLLTILMAKRLMVHEERMYYVISVIAAHVALY